MSWFKWESVKDHSVFAYDEAGLKSVLTLKHQIYVNKSCRTMIFYWLLLGWGCMKQKWRIQYITLNNETNKKQRYA